MQDYQDVSKYASGGAFATLAGSTIKYIIKTLSGPKAVRKLHGLSTYVKHSSPEASKEIQVLRDFVKYNVKGKKLEDQIVKVQGLLKPLYKESKDYRKLKAGQAPPTAAPTAPPTAADPVVDAAKGTTKGWLKSAGSWLNNHPKIVIPTAAIGLGTGAGRWALGNGLAATQSSPSSWFGGDASQVDSGDYITINGTRIPIKRSSEGGFILNEGDAQPSMQGGGDDLDSILAGINNSNLGDTQQPPQAAPPALDQDTINNLFEQDQW